MHPLYTYVNTQLKKKHTEKCVVEEPWPVYCTVYWQSLVLTEIKFLLQTPPHTAPQENLAANIIL